MPSPDTITAIAPRSAICTMTSIWTSPASIPRSIACWIRIGTTTRPAAPIAANIQVTPSPWRRMGAVSRPRPIVRTAESWLGGVSVPTLAASVGSMVMARPHPSSCRSECSDSALHCHPGRGRPRTLRPARDRRSSWPAAHRAFRAQRCARRPRRRRRQRGRWSTAATPPSRPSSRSAGCAGVRG